MHSTEAKEARRAYQKAWRAKNKDKVRAANERYWLKKGLELAEMKSKEAGGCD